ncbi:MAG: hypothetical protein V7K41_23045 [Nostoc sp.]|uniref:hypothetical protein n=1 Tax=Nostoc sp. TaxID=1180 RepID=UPI002FF4D0D9
MRLTSFIPLTLVFFSTLIPINSVFAYPSGCTTPPAGSRYYMGGLQGLSVVWGSQATIETQDIDMCAGTSAESNQNAIWVGIDNQNSGWVQIGYRRLSNQLSNHVYQEARSNVTSNYYFREDEVPSGTNTYKVDLSWGGTNTTSQWNYYKNGVLRPGSLAYTDVQITPNLLQVQDEMNNPGNQVAGTISNPVSWSGIYIKTSLTGSYTSTSVNKNISSGISSHVGTNMSNTDNAWETWDTRYP